MLVSLFSYYKRETLFSQAKTTNQSGVKLDKFDIVRKNVLGRRSGIHRNALWTSIRRPSVPGGLGDPGKSGGEWRESLPGKKKGRPEGLPL
jgi:hypothetical protein